MFKMGEMSLCKIICHKNKLFHLSKGFAWVYLDAWHSYNMVPKTNRKPGKKNINKNGAKYITANALLQNTFWKVLRSVHKRHNVSIFRQKEKGTNSILW